VLREDRVGLLDVLVVVQWAHNSIIQRRERGDSSSLCSRQARTTVNSWINPATEVTDGEFG
jgi:hypothetical protein